MNIIVVIIVVEGREVGGARLLLLLLLGLLRLLGDVLGRLLAGRFAAVERGPGAGVAAPRVWCFGAGAVVGFVRGGVTAEARVAGRAGFHGLRVGICLLLLLLLLLLSILRVGSTVQRQMSVW